MAVRAKNAELQTITGNLSGTAAVATKAIQDSAGQQINTTYIKALSVSGRTITYTKGDGTTGTITTQDTNTDTLVQQSETITENYRPLLVGYKYSTDTSQLAETVTNVVYASTKMYTQPSTGTIFATKFKGNLEGNADTATRATKLYNSGHLSTVDAVNGFIEASTFKYATVDKLEGATGPYSSGDGTIISIPWTTNKYGHQLFIDDNAYCIHHRFMNNGSWSDWAELIGTHNYTSYTVTKTGGGASGTWGINVTGSAGSVAWGNVTDKPSSYPPSSHNHDDTYLKLSGGIITGDLTFTSSNYARNTHINYNGMHIKVDTGGWAIGVNWQKSNGDALTSIGAYGSADSLSYLYFGGTYSDPYLKILPDRSVVATKFTGALSGNATTATTASKLGTATVGGTAKPIYLNAGTATALSDTVGGATQPVYLNAGTITASNASVGNSATPVYMENGVIKSTGKSFSSYVLKRENGYSYNHLASYYPGGNTPTIIRIYIPKQSSTWTMCVLEMTLKENYGNATFGKIIFHGNWSSAAEWNKLYAETFGRLTDITMYASDKQYIYIKGSFSWPTLTVDKMLIGDSATGYDLSGITIDNVTALPTTYQTVTMQHGVLSSDVSENATASTIVRRNASNHTFFGYINSNTSNNENPTISQIIVTNGSDHYYRKASLTHLRNSLACLPLSGGTMTGNISFKGTSGQTNTMIAFKSGGDTAGDGIIIGGGGLTVIGSGESAPTVAAQYTAGTETMCVASDGAIYFYSNMQNGWDSRKTALFSTDGVFSAPTFSGSFSGSLSGNATSATTATSATNDSSGQKISTTYIKGLSVSGRTITYTKGDGTTGTITTQDTNTTYSVATTSANGLMSSTDKAKLDGIASGANAYTHPSHTAYSSGLYKVTVNALGHVTAATAVTKADITALGIPASDTNTWRGIQNNLTSDSTTDSLSAAQGKALKALVDGKAASSHTHSYLPLSGGTLSSSTAQIIRNGTSTSWINGRAVSMLRVNTISGYSPAISIKTTNGSWEIGAYDTSSYADKLVFSYCTDANYNAGNNTTTAQIRFNSDGSIDGTIPWGSVTGKPSSFTPASHTHNYAGSSSAGGAANSLSYFKNTSTTNVGIDDTSANAIGYVSGTSAIMSQSDGAMYKQVYNASWVHEIYGDYRTGQLAVRGKNNGTWQAWRKVLDSSNYTDYTVTKTGSGASGSWGISVTGSSASCTGNAASATKLATARTIALTGSVTGSGTFDGSGNLSIATTTNHTHSYAGSSSAGGSATSAVKLDTASAGSATQPVYWTGGKPAACTYTLGKSVPSDAVFTDTNTHYTTHLYAGTSSGVANAATTNGNTYLILTDDSTARNRIKIAGSGGTTVTSDASGNITINSATSSSTASGITVTENTTEAVSYSQIPFVTSYSSGTATLTKSKSLGLTLTEAGTASTSRYATLSIGEWVGGGNCRVGKLALYYASGGVTTISTVSGSSINPYFTYGGAIHTSGGNSQQAGATTDYTTYKFRNIGFGTTSTPTSDSNYGGSGSIYFLYS